MVKIQSFAEFPVDNLSLSQSFQVLHSCWTSLVLLWFFLFPHFTQKIISFFYHRLLICFCAHSAILLVEFSLVILKFLVLFISLVLIPVPFESPVFRQYLLIYFFQMGCQTCQRLSFWGHQAIGQMSRVFASGPGDRGSNPGRVIPKTQKMVLDAALLSTQHYKVRIKSKVKQSRECSRALLYTLV